MKLRWEQAGHQQQGKVSTYSSSLVSEEHAIQPSKRLAVERVKEMLGEALDAADAEETLQTVIMWGRYAELFNYDDRRGQLDFADH